MNQEEFDDHFIKTRRIFLWGDIVEDNARDTVLKLKFLSDISKDPIYLYVHSNGGDVDCADAIMDEMRGTIKRGVELNTIATGKAYSAGCLIVAFGSPGRRYATENASFMIHSVSFELNYNYGKQQQRQVDFVNKKDDIVFNQFCQVCGKGTKGKKYQDFKEQIEKELWLTAQEAKKHGIIDDIWDYLWENEVYENSDE